MLNPIKTIIIDALQELNDCLENKISIEAIDRIVLFGAAGSLDSISLVRLIILIEEKLEETLGVNIILANDKAMSAKHSPFASVDSLVNFINSLIEEEKANA